VTESLAEEDRRNGGEEGVVTEKDRRNGGEEGVVTESLAV
jgi:hypothetical protein